MFNINKLLHASLLIVVVGVAGGCDWGPGGSGDTVVFDGVEVTAEGDATLSVEDGVLYVRNLGGTNEGGFVVDGDLVRLDVETDAVDVAPSADRRFGVVVRDGNGEAIGQLFAEGIGTPSLGGGPLFDLPFAFADADEVQFVRIRYRLSGQVVYEIDSLYVGQGSAFGAAALASAGTGEGVAGSVHVIRGPDGKYTVVSDTEGSGARPGVLEGGCSAYLISPPNDTISVCTDWVEVTPLDGATRSAQSTAVIGRGVDEIAVQRLVVERQPPGVPVGN